jgi:glutaredoxin
MSKPVLYIKQGCPWCIDALAYFKEIGLNLDVVDVINNPSKMEDLLSCSGQSKTPTLKNDNFVVADFDIDEFKQSMIENPNEAKKLGLLSE